MSSTKQKPDLEAERRRLWTNVFLEGVLRRRDWRSAIHSPKNIDSQIIVAAMYADDVLKVWDAQWRPKQRKGKRR